ncbi:hypothetical protein RRG08_002477 [Elysia crispata]|uniref:Uncharacterized protein n=1 Tax=Elysia crispata TaxID=231223 RepID=A0AAE1A9D9_9GAST|nr:hypothetical protein RRG08_002477 [Elysia crispata]
MVIVNRLPILLVLLCGHVRSEFQDQKEIDQRNGFPLLATEYPDLDDKLTVSENLEDVGDEEWREVDQDGLTDKEQRTSSWRNRNGDIGKRSDDSSSNDKEDDDYDKDFKQNISRLIRIYGFKGLSPEGIQRITSTASTTTIRQKPRTQSTAMITQNPTAHITRRATQKSTIHISQTTTTPTTKPKVSSSVSKKSSTPPTSAAATTVTNQITVSGQSTGLVSSTLTTARPRLTPSSTVAAAGTSKSTSSRSHTLVSTTAVATPAPPTCYQCGDASTPCSPIDLLIGQPQPCPQETSYYMVDIIQNAGTREVRKRCVDQPSCRKKWFDETSDQGRCITFDPPDQNHQARLPLLLYHR